MTDERPSEVLGALPRTRPHRRSEKRPARPAAAGASATATLPKRSAPSPRPRRPTPAPARPPRLRQPAQPEGIPTVARRGRPPAPGSDLLGTAVQAAAELAEIGLSLTARALRQAVARLPRP